MLTRPNSPAMPVPAGVRPDDRGLSIRERLVVAALTGAAAALVEHRGPVGGHVLAVAALAVQLADATLRELNVEGGRWRVTEDDGDAGVSLAQVRADARPPF